MQIATIHNARRAARLMVAAAAMLMVRMPSEAQYTRTPMRTITGTVQDASHEPLRGAVVQMEAAGTLAVQSYVTDERGEYHFRNMASDTDYTLFATFRGNKSKPHPVSKFDHTLDRVISLEIVLVK